MIALQKSTGIAVLCLLFVSAFLGRFPYYFEDVISWDESTLLIVGNSVLEGHLPYTALWDIKPPLAFFGYALFLTAFGKSIVAIRLAGTLCVTATAFFVYLIARKSYSQRTSIIGGLLAIALIGYMPDGQATMTEIMVLPFLVAAVYGLISNRMRRSRNFFGVGILLAIAALVRLNLLYVSLVIGLSLLYLLVKQKESSIGIISKLGAYVLGHLIPIAIVLTPYFLIGEVGTLWHSVILASLSYANFQAPNVELSSWLMPWIYRAHEWAWILPLLGSIYLLTGVTKLASPKAINDVQFWTLIALAAKTLSILRGGSLQGHYLIQLAPFLALLLMQVGHRLWLYCKQLYPIRFLRLAQTTVIISLVLISPVFGEYRSLLSAIASPEGLYASSAPRKVADYLSEIRDESETVYMLTDHLVYWLINESPLTACTTHPSNIVKSSLLEFCANDSEATSESEIAKIFALEPAFVIKLEGIPKYFRAFPVAWELVSFNLSKDYTLLETVGRREIYKRI